MRWILEFRYRQAWRAQRGRGAGRACGIKPTDTPAPRDLPHDKGDAARGARHDLLKDWMGSHTRILGLWLDRLLEEGDDAELVSMIHRQHAWLSMMQVRMERG